MRNSILALIFVAAGCGLAGCASQYRAYDVSSGDGYSESRVSQTEWRVEYAGASVDSAAVVERRLLHRAAELTLQSGYDWFAPSARDVTQETEIIVEAASPVEPVGSVWRPRWRHRSNFRWVDWDPRGAEPSRPRAARAETAERFSAVANISMGRLPMPAQGAFDARAVDAANEEGGE